MYFNPIRDYSLPDAREPVRPSCDRWAECGVLQAWPSERKRDHHRRCPHQTALLPPSSSSSSSTGMQKHCNEAAICTHVRPIHPHTAVLFGGHSLIRATPGSHLQIIRMGGKTSLHAHVHFSRAWEDVIKATCDQTQVISERSQHVPWLRFASIQVSRFRENGPPFSYSHFPAMPRTPLLSCSGLFLQNS